MAEDFSFQIIENIGTLSTSKAGWTLELNIVSWGGRPGKYDLRSWSPDHNKMGKGVTLDKDEIEKLKEILSEI